MECNTTIVIYEQPLNAPCRWQSLIRQKRQEGVQFEGQMYFFTVFVLMETGLMLYSIVVEFSDMSV